MAYRKGFSSHGFLKDAKNLLPMYLIAKTEVKNAQDIKSKPWHTFAAFSSKQYIVCMRIIKVYEMYPDFATGKCDQIFYLTT